MKKTLKAISAAVAFVVGLGAAQAASTSVVVDAKANSYTDGVGLATGVMLSAGQLFDVSAAVTDLWAYGVTPLWSNADGAVGNLYATGTDDSGEAAGVLIGINFGSLVKDGLTSPFGSLVGRVGSGALFGVGTDYTGTADMSGELRLYFWDINSYDNMGSVSATISTNTVSPSGVPVPSTLLLTLIGMAGLRVHARGITKRH